MTVSYGDRKLESTLTFVRSFMRSPWSTPAAISSGVNGGRGWCKNKSASMGSQKPVSFLPGWRFICMYFGSQVRSLAASSAVNVPCTGFAFGGSPSDDFFFPFPLCEGITLVVLLPVACDINAAGMLAMLEWVMWRKLPARRVSSP